MLSTGIGLDMTAAVLGCMLPCCPDASCGALLLSVAGVAVVFPFWRPISFPPATCVPLAGFVFAVRAVLRVVALSEMSARCMLWFDACCGSSSVRGLAAFPAAELSSSRGRRRPANAGAPPASPCPEVGVLISGAACCGSTWDAPSRFVSSVISDISIVPD
jgi:hypothetical protein